MNVAIIGSNFALRGYLPALIDTKKYKVKIICSRNIKKINKNKFQIRNIILENNWKKVFKKKINLIILAVPPKLQEKIIKYNFSYKKKIIFEKPISQQYTKSEKIVKLLKEKKIKSEINLTYLNHDLFNKLKLLILRKKLGRVKRYSVVWSFKGIDFNNRIKTWKTDEKQGGGIKNIFLTHVFSYCEFLFGSNRIIKSKIKYSKFKGLKYKKFISSDVNNPDNIYGKISVFNKKTGFQNHKISIWFEKGYIKLFTKSKDWTKDFILKIHSKNKITTIKSKNKFKDGRSQQIYNMLMNFKKKQSYKNLNFCLNAEKINSRIN
tara:strand:+ start:894 stop:1856 length:963 start_codon:yes stop_codon:yes gene_type:complete